MKIEIETLCNSINLLRKDCLDFITKITSEIQENETELANIQTKLNEHQISLKEFEKEYEELIYKLDTLENSALDKAKEFTIETANYITGLQNPSNITKKVCKCLIMVLGYQFKDWKYFQVLATNNKELLSAMLDFNKEQITEESYKEIMNLKDEITMFSVAELPEKLNLIPDWLFLVKNCKDVQNDICHISERMILCNNEIAFDNNLSLKFKEDFAKLSGRRKTILNYISQIDNLLKDLLSVENAEKIVFYEEKFGEMSLEIKDKISHFIMGKDSFYDSADDLSVAMEDAKNLSTIKCPFTIPIIFKNKKLLKEVLAFPEKSNMEHNSMEQYARNSMTPMHKIEPKNSVSG